MLSRPVHPLRASYFGEILYYLLSVENFVPDANSILMNVFAGFNGAGLTNFES